MTTTSEHPAALSFGAVARSGGRWLPVLAAASLTGTVAMLALPLLLAGAVDAVVAGEDAARWMAAAAVLIAVSVAGEIVDAFAGAACTASVTARIRRQLVGHLLRLLPHRLRAFPTGDLVARVSAHSADAAHAGPSLVGAAGALLPSVGSLALLAYLDWRLAVAFTAGLVLVALVLRLFTVRTTAAVAAYQRVQGRLAAALAEALDGGRTIAAAGTVDREQRRVLSALPELRRHGVETWRVLAATSAQGALVGPLVMVAVLATAGFSLTDGRISAGEVLAAAQYAMMGAGVGGLTGVFATLARARAGVGRTAEVLAAPAAGHGDTVLPDGGGRLEFTAVSVVDDGERLLDGVDVTVPAGSAAAVVGASGAGKTILAQLAARLRDPDEGEVRLDGVALRHLPQRTLRRAVGVAFERPVLVGGTVGDAIGPDLDHEAVRAAAQAADAHDFASRLPMGYATPLSDAPMSGGEAQRIGLARAWRAERLLVLDDATSSLDTVTEMRIIKALTGVDDHAAPRTRLIVTHRPATAARADTVVWLDGGRVRAIGPHRTLWEHPDYRKVFR